MAEEVQDIRAYRKFVADSWAAPSASAVLVGFHNLVTASIVDSEKTRKFLSPERRSFYCSRQVVDALPRAFFADLSASPALPPPADGVPGLAPYHREVACGSS